MISIKRFLPRGLLGRSLLIIVIPLVVLQIVMGIFFYDRHWANVSRHRAISLAGDISIIIRLLREEDGSLSQEDVIAMARAHFRIFVEVLPSGPGVDGSFEPKGLLETTVAAALNGPFGGTQDHDPRISGQRITRRPGGSERRDHGGNWQPCGARHGRTGNLAKLAERKPDSACARGRVAGPGSAFEAYRQHYPGFIGYFNRRRHRYFQWKYLCFTTERDERNGWLGACRRRAVDARVAVDHRGCSAKLTCVSVWAGMGPA